MNLNVAHIVLSLEIGGLEVLVYEMAKNLVEKGHQSTIYCLDSEGTLAQQVRDCGVPVILVNRKSGPVDISAIQRLRALIRKQNHSIIHTHNLEPMFYGAIASIGLSNIKVIHTQHGLPTPFGFLTRLKARISGIFADCFIAVSDNTAKFAAESGWVKPGKITTILNGINTDRFKPDAAARQRIRHSLGLNDMSFVAICVARLSPIKNHDRLIKVFRTFIDSVTNTDAILLLVGEGETRSSIEKLVHSLNLKKHVRLLGESLETDALLAASDIFLLSSDSEGISVSILEAMSTGLPAIVTDVGGNSEIVKNNETGYLVPKENNGHFSSQIKVLLNDPVHRKELSKNARRQVVKRFSMQTMLASYQSKYMELLDGK